MPIGHKRETQQNKLELAGKVATANAAKTANSTSKGPKYFSKYKTKNKTQLPLAFGHILSPPIGHSQHLIRTYLSRVGHCAEKVRAVSQSKGCSGQQGFTLDQESMQL